MLKDFCHGNIIRPEHHYQNPEYQELAKKWLALSTEFENTLDSELPIYRRSAYYQ